MWEPAEPTFCPVCGDGDVEVNERHDDYYLGELYRCSNGHHFHWQPQEAPVHVRRTGPPSPFETFLMDSDKLIADGLMRPSVLLEELVRGEPKIGGDVVRIPLIRRID